MDRPKRIFFVILIMLLVPAACSAQPTQIPPTATLTQTLPSGHGISSEERELPLTEADVPRIIAEEARTALESGAAIMVDVRSPSAFQESHVAGAISVPLGMIERDLASIPLNKDQWIITYCT